MAATIEVPVTVSDGGYATFIVAPYSCIYQAAVLNGRYLPFALMTGGTAVNNFPYTTLGTYSQDGPFAGRINDIVNYAIDSVKIRYVNTQPLINVSGKLTSSIFY